MKVSELFEGFWGNEPVSRGRDDELAWRNQPKADPQKPEWAVTDKKGKPIRRHITRAAADALVKNRTDWKAQYGQLYVKAMTDL
jgi:hypothetical protein